MKQLTGKLEFVSIYTPIIMSGIDGDESIDLRDYMFPLFEKLNGLPVSVILDMNAISVVPDEKADHIFTFKKTENALAIWLDRKNPMSYSNTALYLENQFQRLNGRTIDVSITDANELFIRDNGDKVQEIKYTDSNSCKISMVIARNVCKIATGDCCIFLGAGAKGMECLKFDSHTSRNLLDKHLEKTMNAKRIGNCRIVGRDDGKQNELNNFTGEILPH